MERAQEACTSIKQRFGVEVMPVKVAKADDVGQVLTEAYAVLCTGAAGVTLIPESIWAELPNLKILADINAVPPLGIDGIEVTWDGQEKHGKIIFGALSIGGFKMKIHRAAIARLFEKNDLVLDAEEIYKIAKKIEG